MLNVQELAGLIGPPQGGFSAAAVSSNSKGCSTKSNSLGLSLVYGFMEITDKWISTLPEELPIQIFTTHSQLGEVYYDTHPTDAFNKEISQKFIAGCEVAAMSDPEFITREKPIMDALARERGCTPQWIVVMEGQFHPDTCREEDDGYDESNPSGSTDLTEDDFFYTEVVELREKRRKLISELLELARAPRTPPTSGDLLIPPAASSTSNIELPSVSIVNPQL